ncbi:MAG: hypothetical protein RLZ98_2917, partial [Pseudomonadota bacterium]
MAGARSVGVMWAVSAALTAGAVTAHAGGFAVREQSTVHQGASFAGNAAGTVISSQFWNPAALGNAGAGLTTESSYSLLYSQSDFTATGGTAIGVFPGAELTTDTGGFAFVGASYASYRWSDDLVFGLGFNAPFGLGSEPDSYAWVGSAHGRSAKLTTYNLNPNFAYRLAPNFWIGAGVQLEFANLRFKFGAPVGAVQSNAVLDLDDTVGVGFTAGALWHMAPTTTLGLGFRSSVKHTLSGDAFNVAAVGLGGQAEAELETPETVTLSLRHSFTQQFRALGTIEWANWSRLESVPVTCTSGANLLIAGCGAGGQLGVLDANWDDGWFYSLGFEYDYQPGLTLRSGIAYEQSPMQNAAQRLYQVPDSDRIWLSAGLSYKLWENTTLDFAYTHIFLEDAEVSRGTLTNPALTLTADREGSVDIVSVGYRMRWGGGA